MPYPVRVAIGAFRAFVPGAWLWRVLFWVFSLLPISGVAATLLPGGRQLLAELGLSSLTVWQFGFVAAVFATVFFAIRIAIFETPQIRLEDLTIYVDENRIGCARAKIRNVSGTDIGRVKASLESIHQYASKAYRETLDVPIILLTQQRLRRLSDQDDSPPQKKFELQARDYKYIELLQIPLDHKILKIRHESGEETLSIYDTLFEYRVIGGHSDITFWAKFLYDPQSQRHVIFPIRDRAMLVALEMLGNQGWWEGDAHGSQKVSQP